MEFGDLEGVISLMSGCEYNTEVWWCGVIGILLPCVGIFDMVPAVSFSDRGVYSIYRICTLRVSTVMYNNKLFNEYTLYIYTSTYILKKSRILDNNTSRI